MVFCYEHNWPEWFVLVKWIECPGMVLFLHHQKRIRTGNHAMRCMCWLGVIPLSTIICVEKRRTQSVASISKTNVHVMTVLAPSYSVVILPSRLRRVAGLQNQDTQGALSGKRLPLISHAALLLLMENGAFLQGGAFAGCA